MTAEMLNSMRTLKILYMIEKKRIYIYLPTILHGNHNIIKVNIDEYLINKYTFILNI